MSSTDPSTTLPALLLALHEQEAVSMRVLLRALLAHPGFWIAQRLSAEDEPQRERGRLADGSAFLPVYTSQAVLAEVFGAHAAQTAQEWAPLPALLPDGDDAVVVVNAGHAGALTLDAGLRGALAALVPAAAVERSLVRLRWDDSEATVRAEANLLRHVAEYPDYQLVADGGHVLLAPDDKGRRLLAVFTADDTVTAFLDTLLAPAGLTQRLVTRMPGAELFRWAGEQRLDGVVFNCVGPARPVAFAPAFADRVLESLPAITPVQDAEPAVPSAAAPGWPAVLPTDPTGLPLPPSVLAALQAGSKIQAIKLLIDATGIGLVLAKEWVETQQQVLADAVSGLPSTVLAPLRAGSKIQAVAALRSARGLGIAAALQEVDAALREDPVLREQYLEASGLGSVVRLDIRDGLQLPSGVVAAAGYALVVYCRVAPDWLPTSPAGPEPLQNAVFARLYGEHWRGGNSDGSRYVVREVLSQALSALQQQQRPWSAAADSPQQRHWFFHQLADRSLVKVEQAAF